MSGLGEEWSVGRRPKLNAREVGAVNERGVARRRRRGSERDMLVRGSQTGSERQMSDERSGKEKDGWLKRGRDDGFVSERAIEC
jgi:hypothetical protein